MANGNVTPVDAGWVQIANSGLTAVSFMNKTDRAVYIAATAADSEPTGDPEDWPYWQPGTGEVGMDMTALFSGVSAAYLWAYCVGTGVRGSIWRSHA